MSQSNRPVGTPLSTPAAAPTAAAASQPTPHPAVPSDAKARSSATPLTSYQALENKFKEIGIVATSLMLAAEKANKTDIDFYAISYGLILMDTLMQEILLTTDQKKNLPIICVRSGFVDSSMAKFSQIIDQLKNIRNMLSDHFIRITPKIQNSLFNNLNLDFERLGNFAKTETQDDEGCRLGAIKIISQSLSAIQDLTVSYKDRACYLLSSLERIDQIKQQYNSHQDVDRIKDQYAISMLYIVAGTCAREIKMEASRRSISHSADSVFTELGKLRQDLAHYSYLGIAPNKFAEKILAIDNSDFIQAINKDIDKFYHLSNPTEKSPYQKKFFIQPHQASTAASASSKPTISPIEALKAQLAASKLKQSAQHSSAADSKHATPPINMATLGAIPAASNAPVTVVPTKPLPAAGAGAGKAVSPALNLDQSTAIASGASSQINKPLENRKNTMMLALHQSIGGVIFKLFKIKDLMDKLPWDKMNLEEQSFKAKIILKLNELVGSHQSILNNPRTDIDHKVSDLIKLDSVVKNESVTSLFETFEQNFALKFNALDNANKDISNTVIPKAK